MKTRRPYYRTKAEWAEATAQRLETDLARERERRIPSSDWRKVRAKAAGVDCLRREITRFRQMAERFKAAGA